MWPVSRYPSRSAVVRMARTSEPASVSVREKQQTRSPRMSGSRFSSNWCSVAYRRMSPARRGAAHVAEETASQHASAGAGLLLQRRECGDTRGSGRRTPRAGGCRSGEESPTTMTASSQEERVAQLLRVQYFSVSSDGIGAGEDQTLERPFGHVEPEGCSHGPAPRRAGPCEPTPGGVGAWTTTSRGTTHGTSAPRTRRERGEAADPPECGTNSPSGREESSFRLQEGGLSGGRSGREGDLREQGNQLLLLIVEVC